MLNFRPTSDWPGGAMKPTTRPPKPRSRSDLVGPALAMAFITIAIVAILAFVWYPGTL